MTKLKWNRPNGGYTDLGSNIPKMPPPLTPMARKAWATQKRNLALKHELANKPKEQVHAQHLATVIQQRTQYYLWCKECQTIITELSQTEYNDYIKLFPPQVRRVKK